MISVYWTVCLDIGILQRWHPGSWLSNPYIGLTLKPTDKAERLLTSDSRIQETAASLRDSVIPTRGLHFPGLLVLNGQTIVFTSPSSRADVRRKWEHANEGAL